MKLSTQAAIAAITAALLASPVLAQTKTGPLPPTGTSSDYQNPNASGSTSSTATTKKGAAKSSAAKSTTAAKETTRQEYLDQAAKRFDAMDKNHDGLLSSAERRSATTASKSTPNKSTTANKSSSSISTSPSSSSAASSSAIAPSSGSRAISPPAISSDKPLPNNSGSAPNPANTPAKM